MKKTFIAIITVSLAVFGMSGFNPANAKMGCPYGGSLNWEGNCDVTTEEGNSYFGPPIEVPDDPPPPPPPPLGTDQDAPGLGNSVTNDMPTSIISNPVTVVSPDISGNDNTFSSNVNNTVINNTTSNINNVIDNTSSISNIFEVSGGYLVVGQDGLANFFPEKNKEEHSDKKDLTNVEYLELKDLPRSIRRAVKRIPSENQVGGSIKLSRVIKNSESLSEDVCSIDKRTLNFYSVGSCILEIPVGNNVYEHEIEIT